MITEDGQLEGDQWIDNHAHVGRRRHHMRRAKLETAQYTSHLLRRRDIHNRHRYLDVLHKPPRLRASAITPTR